MIDYKLEEFYLSVGNYMDIMCRVPCSVHSVLSSLGYVKSPYCGMDYKEARGLSVKECSFKSVFKADASILSSKHVYLTLEGIAAKADVVINDKSFGFVDDPQKSYCFEITDVLKEGDNHVVLNCHSAVDRVCAIGEAVNELKRAYIEDVGILGAVSVKATTSAIIDKISLVQKHTDGKVDLTVNMTTLGESSDVRAVATLISPVGKIYFGSFIKGKAEISIPDPVLWWPHSLGIPYLYKLSVALYSDEEAVDTKEVEIGLCNIYLEKDDGGNQCLNVNGRRIKAFGATYGREDVISSVSSPEKTENLIKEAVRANFNTLYVDSAEFYPTEHFYRLCDKYGLIVWQGIFVRYIKNVLAAEFIISRSETISDMLAWTSIHPSVMVPELVVVSDPLSPMPEEAGLEEFIDACRRIADLPYAEMYPDSRLTYTDGGRKGSDEICSALGVDVVSLPSIKTLEELVNGEDMNILSPTMEMHTEGSDSISQMISGICSEYRYPYDLESIVFASQAASCERLIRSIDKMRMENSGIYTAIRRRLNDSMPVISSSFVDYYGRPKLVMYALRKLYDPVYVYAIVEGGKVTLGISNEHEHDYLGMLSWCICDSDDNIVSESVVKELISGGSSKTVAEFELDTAVMENPENYYMTYELMGEKSIEDVGSRLFVAPKRYNFRDPAITVSVSGSGRNFEITLESKAYARFVTLEAAVKGEFSDNLFDMKGNEKKKIFFNSKENITATKLEKLVTVKSVYDIGMIKKQKKSSKNEK